MTTYNAAWQDKRTTIVYNENFPFAKIEFDDSQWPIYGSATLFVGDKIFRAELANGNNTIIMHGDAEIFTAVFHPLWGNLELRQSGQDTGYDIKGKWFKPGTRLTDADDNDLVVITADMWTGKNIEISAVPDISGLMVVATLYYHIRASAAKTTGMAAASGI